MNLKNLICALAVPFALTACKPDFPVKYEMSFTLSLDYAVVAYVGKERPWNNIKCDYCFDTDNLYVYDSEKTMSYLLQKDDAWLEYLVFYSSKGLDPVTIWLSCKEPVQLPGQPEGLCKELPMRVDLIDGEEYAFAAFCSGNSSQDMKHAEAWAKKMQELFSKKFE